MLTIYLRCLLITALAVVGNAFPSPDTWRSLNFTLGGGLLLGEPFAKPCWDADPNSEATSFRSMTSGGYVNPEWETCITSGDQCLLDYTDPTNVEPLRSTKCKRGSVPAYFIDVHDTKDILTGLAFARKHKISLVVKNTGHDYLGRSSAPGSLALWIHRFREMSYVPAFVPEGCSSKDSNPGVTVGASVQWFEAYAFAEANNITVVGGTDPSVGVAGGWLQGGGHSVLSNTMGLGVDRVLQFKVITPDGVLRVANQCQNTDLFFALRGGGGGTFGIVIESTILASPQVTLQAVFVGYANLNATMQKQVMTTQVENAVQWAEAGWGGASTPTGAVFVNPKADEESAARTMAPLISFVDSLVDDGVTGASITLTTFQSFASFYAAFLPFLISPVGVPLALSSRLINKANFETAENRSALVNALFDAQNAVDALLIQSTTPASVNDSGTSVTGKWRESLYHVSVVSRWNWNATKATRLSQFTRVDDAMTGLRALTPDAAYFNEASVHEPNYKVSFWGDNYSRLLQIKKHYDPEHLLNCWNCVGFDSHSSQFSCYP
ncbi:hypothetical protein IW261DRAFT_1618059 [Armillaria novae-zelandiae]|uniref:FAD-binding PCMH-type domain-containing protein n=1 Tax=Armillaria novae-zelandiae TaxID=153914 RepID=A0AA39PUE0_9AGAR|nr:hypothetical protein IW261DRAFT_1618059 [Armillaria novae-zelandiae]